MGRFVLSKKRSRSSRYFVCEGEFVCVSCSSVRQEFSTVHLSIVTYSISWVHRAEYFYRCSSFLFSSSICSMHRSAKGEETRIIVLTALIVETKNHRRDR